MKKPYYNAGQTVVHIGTVAIWPGETRDVDETLLPAPADEGENDQQAQPEGDELLNLLDQSVEAIKALLPDLADDELRTLMDAEQNGKTRKSLMQAFEQELLTRAGEMEDNDLPDPA